VVSEFSSTWEAACTAAGVFIPVGSIVASSRGSRARALAIAGVPVEALTAIVISINTLAGTVTGVPVVVFSANLFKAVAAAAVDVPVEAFSALVNQAAAFAVFTVLGNEPVEATLAFLFLAFPSAGVGVPVLALLLCASWSAEALTAFVVPVVVSTAGTWVLTDTLARVVVPE